MKKTLLALTTALTLPATITLADGPNVQFYGGAQAGGSLAWTKFKTASTNTANIAPTAETANLKKNSNDPFGTAGLFAGARFFFGDFFTGLEIEANWDGMNIQTHLQDPTLTEAWRIEMRRRSQIIPSATLGWKMNEKTALYAKFGAGVSHFDISFNRNDADSTSKKATIVHFVPALGAEYELNKNAALRFDVSGEFAGTYIKGNSVTSNAVSQRTKVRYRAISAKLGVLFKV